MELACSIWLLQFPPKDIHGVRLIDDFKLAVSVNGCVVSPATDF